MKNTHAKRLITGALGLSTLLLFSNHLFAHPTIHAQLETLEHEVELQPHNQTLAIQRALAYINKEDFAKAKQELHRAEQIGPVSYLYSAYGFYYLGLNNSTLAIRFFSKQLHQNPNDTDALEQRAELYKAAGYEWKAKNDYQHLVKVKSQPSPGHYVAIAELQEHLEGEGIFAALKTLDEGMARLGEIPHLQRKAISLELQVGRMEQAIQRHSSLAQALNHSPSWQVELADLQLKAGDVSSAKVNYEKALEVLKSARNTPANRDLVAHIKQVTTEFQI